MTKGKLSSGVASPKYARQQEKKTEICRIYLCIYCQFEEYPFVGGMNKVENY